MRPHVHFVTVPEPLLKLSDLSTDCGESIADGKVVGILDSRELKKRQDFIEAIGPRACRHCIEKAAEGSYLYAVVDSKEAPKDFDLDLTA